MAQNLSAPVGDPKSKNPKPANKPKDVELLQLALLANGYPMEIDGRMSSMVITCIESFQRTKAKMKPTTSVIEPGDRTWALLQPRLKAYEKEILSFEAYEVVENGRKKRITVQDWTRIEQETRERMIERARAMMVEADNISGCIREMHKAADGSSGFVNAMVSLGVRVGKGIEIPSEKAALDARGAAQMLIALVDRTKPDWAKVEAQHRKASLAINKAVKEWQAFDSKYIDGAEKGLIGATATREISFGVLEVLATGYLVTTSGMPLPQAAAMAAAGCENLKSTAGEVGEYAANDTFDPKASARKIVANTYVAAGSAFVGGKLTGPMLRQLSDKLGEAVARKVSPRLANYIWDYVDKFLNTKAGEEFVKNVSTEAMKLAQKPLGEGKAPDGDDLINAALNATLGSILTLRPIKATITFDQNWPKKALFELADSFARPSVKEMKLQMVKHFPNDLVDEMLSKYGKEIVSDVTTKMRDDAIKLGIQEAMKYARGDESSAADLEKLAAAGLRKDTRLAAEFQAEALLAARRRLEEMQKKSG